METRTLTSHVPVPLADKIDHYAKQLERSKNWIVKQALSNWVLQEEERYKITLEALDDVDNGRVISHQDVKAWANSLSTDAPLKPPTYED